MSAQHEIEKIASRFAVSGELVCAERFTGGHINQSHLLTYRSGGRSARFLLQNINDAVFPNPMLVMQNIQRVTGHLSEKLKSEGVPDPGRRVPSLVMTLENEPCTQDDRGSYWRLYRYIESTRVHESVENAEQAEHAGLAFGTFQKLLADLPTPRLHETIPNFHNTPARFEALDRALGADPCNRAAAAGTEIEFAAGRRPLAGALLNLLETEGIPERIVHNDAKISNVLFDGDTGEALCVVDLDTVMHGTALYDFGDMMRTMTSTHAEDDPDPSRVRVQEPLFEALARGYLQAAGGFITATERRHLVTAGKVITLEQGVRFLTDFLRGDIYYRVQRPGQNLDRCRTQFKLVESIENHEEQMSRSVEGM